ncbi:MAG: ubiquinol-cytochrome c reductase iron-sulfur subunit [Candidatus Omnitrophica bacterium]|nr:ubiquinol-cytochrome c reductase iron-sulfur subunit [Candidatus Omnitrophota bacterium]
MNDSIHHSIDPEDMQRRRFLKRAVGILSVPLAAVFGYPLVAALVGSIYRKSPLAFSKTPGFTAAPEGQPIELSFDYVKTDAYLRQDVVEDVWVIKHSPVKATVFSPICPHMGCRYNWHSKMQEFICPCHGSVFSVTGKVLGGPSPRPLDTLSYKIEGGTLYVEWERFEPGIAEKVRI